MYGNAIGLVKCRRGPSHRDVIGFTGYRCRSTNFRVQK